jgi:hypothetical protein
LRGNKRYPIFDIKTYGYSYKEIYAINSSDQSCVCEGIPGSVENSAVFFLNLKDKTIFANMLCDSIGVWSSNGVPKNYLVKDEEKTFIRP